MASSFFWKNRSRGLKTCINPPCAEISISAYWYVVAKVIEDSVFQSNSWMFPLNDKIITSFLNE